MENNQQSTINNLGFTFLETLVVLAIFGLVFPLIMSILFVILQQQIRIGSLAEVKRQGDYIASYLRNTIADNAFTIYDSGGFEICDADSISAYPHTGIPASFKDKYKSPFSIDYTSPDLAIDFSTPNYPAPTFAFKLGQLNSSKVIVSTFNMSCTRQAPFSAPLVTINYTVCYNLGNTCNSTEPQKVVSLDYAVNIKLRSFQTP